MDQIIDAIPIRHNLVSSVMFMGVVLGFFLSGVIFIRAKKQSPIILFGWSLLIQSIVCLDTYLCYTGLIKYTPHINDCTEPLVLLIPVSIYFFLYGLIERKPIRFRKQGWHFLLPLFYAVSQVNYYLSPISVKANAYLGAYYDTLPKAQIPDDFDYGYLWIKDEFRWLILFTFLLYSLLSFRLIFKRRNAFGKATKNIRIDKYIFSRNAIYFFIFFLILIYVVYINHEDDSGDHYIVMGQTAITLVTLFFILSESRFFENSWIADKYETFTSEAVTGNDIESFVVNESYFLSSHVSLKSLAQELGTSPNAISKSINVDFGVNFNDYINKKRVVVAKGRLLNNEYANLTIEAIGESVGFKSKSAFYSAFRKHADVSPSQYVKENLR